MRILFVISSSEIGGAEKQFLRTAQELESFHEIHICILGRLGPFRSAIQQSGIGYISSKGGLLSDIGTLAKCYFNYRPILTITWLYRADVLGSLMSKIFRIPVIISARNSAWPRNNRLKSFVLRFTARFMCSLIIANSARAIEFHKSIGYPVGKFRLIRNFLSSQNDPGCFTFTDPMTLGLAARPIPGKGHFEAVDAFKEILKYMPEAQLRMIGPELTYWGDLVDYIEPYRTNILIEDGSSNIDDWFEGIDIYLGLSTMWDSDSNSVLEAIMQRIPVICSPIQCIEDLKDSLFVVNPKRPYEVANAILKISNFSIEALEAKTESARSELLKLRNPDNLRAQWLTSVALID